VCLVNETDRLRTVLLCLLLELLDSFRDAVIGGVVVLEGVPADR
jgi:hypothetical protein